MSPLSSRPPAEQGWDVRWEMGIWGWVGTPILEVVGKREGLGEKMTLCGIAG